MNLLHPADVGAQGSQEVEVEVEVATKSAVASQCR